MAIGTIDRTPPPFFRQGPSALTKLILCSALALFLMVADNRLSVTRQLRAVLATALYYPQQVLLMPVQAVLGGGAYLRGLQSALADESAARRALALQSERATRVEQLTNENEHLRALLDLRAGLQVRSQAAQVLYQASDPYSRKVVIDRGAANGVQLASPVINEAGVVGQVTRVFPLSSEVTLLVDKDAGIPVVNQRTLARGVAFGSAAVGSSGMELRFMAGNADVRVGDVLQTSGLDGIYPVGLAVAKVVSVARKLDSGFARIDLVPDAEPDSVRHVLVIEPAGLQMPARPDETTPAPSVPARVLAPSPRAKIRTAP